MSDNSIAKRAAESVFSKYKIVDITLDDVVRVIKDYGFDIIDFNPSDMSDNAYILLNELGLADMSKTAKAFTYQKDIVRLVFVRDDIPSEDKRYLLAHELGHIACGHLPGMDASMQEEFEANEFAHYLLYPGTSSRILFAIRRRWAVVAIVVLLVAGLAIGISVYNRNKKEEEYYKEYYVTSGGEKYHRQDCYYIQGKDNVHRLTVEEHDSGKYEPCQFCQPE